MRWWHSFTWLAVSVECAATFADYTCHKTLRGSCGLWVFILHPFWIRFQRSAQPVEFRFGFLNTLCGLLAVVDIFLREGMDGLACQSTYLNVSRQHVVYFVVLRAFQDGAQFIAFRLCGLGAGNCYLLINCDFCQ